jgi:hypothetical protein
VTVVGSYSTQTAKDSVNGATIPFMSMASAQLVGQPTDPYES